MKVAIIGAGTGQGEGNYYDDSWEIWGLNAMYRRCPWIRRWHRMFNLHRLAHLERDCPEYVAWDAAFSRRNPKVPMVVIDSWKGLLKKEVIFPRKKLIDVLPGSADYHASSFDWMVTYALHLGAEWISLHGVGFGLDSPRDEPISARACLEYWCGVAEGRGVRILASECALFWQYHLVRSHSVYGYDDVTMMATSR